MYTPLEVKASLAAPSGFALLHSWSRKNLNYNTLLDLSKIDSQAFIELRRPPFQRRSSGHATRRYATIDTSVAAAAIIVIHTPMR
jgi:hypothetical protein